MARSTRDANLETRTKRLALKPGRRHWRSVGKGLAMGYRRGAHGGAWYMRMGLPDNRYRVEAIGTADDHQDADGVKVFDFFQAQDKVRELSGQRVKTPLRMTVEDALNDYFAWAELNTKSHAKMRLTAKRYIWPKLGSRRVTDLTVSELRKWHHEIAATKFKYKNPKKNAEPKPDDPDAPRRRKATANRVLSVLKAALNRAYYEEKVPFDDAWRKVKPFAGVAVARIRYLTATDAKRLVNGCDSDLRSLVQAALLTGCRYGELIRLKVGDYNPDTGTIHLKQTKSGKPRYVPVNDEGKAHFDRLAAGRMNDELVFLHADGTPWADSHQIRRMIDACERAKISPRVSFHDLRNTYGALLAMQGVSMKVIAELLGHSDTRITEKHYAHLQESYVAETLRKHLPKFGIARDDVVVPLQS